MLQLKREAQERPWG